MLDNPFPSLVNLPGILCTVDRLFIGHTGAIGLGDSFDFETGVTELARLRVAVGEPVGDRNTQTLFGATEDVMSANEFRLAARTLRFTK